MVTGGYEIAVLMPVYNPGKDLVLTLDSLRAQSLPYKLYLVDDGSKFHADYETLCLGIDAEIIRLPLNLGITGAMNAGLDLILKTPVKFIARIDAGDICKPQRFAKQIAFLKSNPDISILGSAVEFRLRDANENLLESHINSYPASAEGSRQKLFFNVAAIHPAMMIRRDVFEKLKGYSESYPAAEDFDLMWRASKAGLNIANLADVLLVKEEYPGSISQKRRKKQIFNRLRIQWANRNLASARSWVGLTKSSIQLVTPASLSNAIRKVIKR
jgi:GT2 family glycosyltransferase